MPSHNADADWLEWIPMGRKLSAAALARQRLVQERMDELNRVRQHPSSGVASSQLANA